MKTIIIAEIGVNHNGDVALALKMIEEAKRAGADYVKFQTFRAEDLVTSDAPTAEYQKRNDGASSQFEMLKRLELNADDYEILVKKCREENIGFLSTPFSTEAVALLSCYDMDWWKIGSGEITNLPLLQSVARVARRVILSTGMSTLHEIEEALEALVENGMERKNIFLLHCTTSYPAPFTSVNLRAMNALHRLNVGGVGYSDHTEGTAIPVAAVAMGAQIIEKHFTTDRNLAGPDHKASLEPDDFARMVRDIRNVEAALGKSSKEPTQEELKIKAIARKSVVAKTNIKKGDIFTEENLTAKRPGTGISPMNIRNLLGRTSRHDYTSDQLLEQDELI